jgi:hypothetical protein
MVNLQNDRRRHLLLRARAIVATAAFLIRRRRRSDPRGPTTVAEQSLASRASRFDEMGDDLGLGSVAMGACSESTPDR